MSNGNGAYVGSEKRTNGKDRRDHFCLHEEDFGGIKSDLKHLSGQVEFHIESQEKRNQTFYTKFDTISESLTKVSSTQDTLPGKVVEMLEKKKDKKLVQRSALLRNTVTVIAILSAVTTGIFWAVNFIQNNAVASP